MTRIGEVMADYRSLVSGMVGVFVKLQNSEVGSTVELSSIAVRSIEYCV